MNHPHDSTLEELRKSGISLPTEINVEGWCVCNSAQEQIGKVYDLLVDTQESKIRYLIVTLEEEVGDESYKILVPIGMAELHPTKNEIFLPHVGPGEIEHFSPYPYDALKMNSVAGMAVPASPAVFEYDHEHFNEQNFRRGRS